MYPYRTPIQDFTQKHFSPVFFFVCTYLYLWEPLLIYNYLQESFLFCENPFLSMIVCENLFFFVRVILNLSYLWEFLLIYDHPWELSSSWILLILCLIIFVLNKMSLYWLVPVPICTPFAVLNSLPSIFFRDYIFEFNPPNSSFIFLSSTSFILPITLSFTWSKNFESFG